MSSILTLATAGVKPDQLQDINHLQHPRVDYLELESYMDLEVIDYRVYDQTQWGKLFRHIETKVRSDLYLTLLGLRQRQNHKALFAMSERAGIPYAGFSRFWPTQKPFIAMFTCWSPRQEFIIRKLNLLSVMDQIVVHCYSMKNHLVQLGAPAEKVEVIPYSIDHRFFTPLPDVEQKKGVVLSLGEIRSRDYESLFAAVEGLPLNLLVAASGAWYAREKNTQLETQIPSNVKVSGHFPLVELRQLYAQSQFVVLPIKEVIYSAGATAVLEAGCMGRAVIVNRTAGIVDYVIDGETGILVTPGDLDELRNAICYLLNNPAEARRMGENARQRIEEELNLDIYVQKIARLLEKHSLS